MPPNERRDMELAEYCIWEIRKLLDELKRMEKFESAQRELFHDGYLVMEAKPVNQQNA